MIFLGVWSVAPSDCCLDPNRKLPVYIFLDEGPKRKEPSSDQLLGHKAFLWPGQTPGASSASLCLSRYSFLLFCPVWPSHAQTASPIVCAKSFSRVWLCDPMDCSLQAPLSMGFSRQEHWSGLPCPPPGDLPDPGIRPVSLMSPALTGRFFTTSTSWEALSLIKQPQHPERPYISRAVHCLLNQRMCVKVPGGVLLFLSKHVFACPLV